MNDSDPKKDSSDPTDPSATHVDGIKIEKLPSIGCAMTDRGYRYQTRNPLWNKTKSEQRKLQAMARVLAEREKHKKGK